MVNILVCIKQVPDMESKFRINAEGNWYETADLAWRINEYDEYAVEQAIRVKEQHKEGATLTVLSIGPERVQEALKKALAMGCDRGVHLLDDQIHLRQPLEVASRIAEFIRDKGVDLIFTGMQSQDRGSAQVGVLLAEMLGIPAVTTVIDFVCVDGIVTARRELEGGLKAIVETRSPAVITCQLGLNIPRYPTLPNIMKAKKKEILRIEVPDREWPGERLQTVMYFPEKQGGGLLLEGEIEDLVSRLVEILKERTGVLA